MDENKQSDDDQWSNLLQQNNGIFYDDKELSFHHHHPYTFHSSSPDEHLFHRIDTRIPEKTLHHQIINNINYDHFQVLQLVHDDDLDAAKLTELQSKKITQTTPSNHRINHHHQTKKGARWTKEEHEKFLMGLSRYGKGDWRNISRNCVLTKTPTQVASHAQKYFIRLAKSSSTTQNLSFKPK